MPEHATRPLLEPRRWQGTVPAIEPPQPPSWNRREVAWIVSRHHDVLAFLRSSDAAEPDLPTCVGRVCGRAGIAAEGLMASAEGFMPALSGPRHAASRDEFSSRLISLHQRWTLDVLAETVDELVHSLPCGESVDLVAALTSALPTRIVADLLGLPERDARWICRVGSELAAAWHPATALREYRRMEPLTHRAEAILAGRERTSPRHPTRGDSWFGLELFFAAATAASTSATLGAAIHALAKTPDLQQTMRDTPELIGPFIREMFRLAGGVRQASARITTRPVELGPVLLPAGVSVIADIGRANRDPQVFADPDMLDLDRQGPPAIAFGVGSHRCLGMGLAQLQLRAVVSRLVSQWELTSMGPPEIQAYPSFPHYHALPVRLDRLR